MNCRLVNKGLALGACALLGCRTPVYALATDRTIDQLGHESWTSQRGLPGEAVYEILQSSDGYLWLRTSSGLVRFDGIRFVRVDPTGDGVSFGESVRAIGHGADGEMLVRGTSQTLAYKDGGFTQYGVPIPLPDGSTRRIYETREHGLWIGADDLIYRLHDGQISMVKRGTGWVDAFLEDSQGTLWIGGGRGLYQYRQETLTVEPSPQPDLGFPALLEDHRGGLWFGTSRGLYRMQGGAWVPASTIPALMNDRVSAMLEDHNHNIWVGTTNSGLYRLTNGQWSSIAHADGLSDDAVLSLAEDREGDLWVGTASGLDEFRDVSIASYTKAEGLLSNTTTTAMVDSSGTVNIFAQGGGLTQLKNSVATGFAARQGLGSLYGGALFSSRDGSLWIGTEQGLVRFKDGKFTTYSGAGRLNHVYISAINEDAESLIVATTETLAFRFREGALSEFTMAGKTTPLSKPGNYTFTIYRDPSGVLWFGTVGGLYKFAPGEPPENAQQAAVNFPVTAIYDDHRGNLWLGGRIAGVTRFGIKDGGITRYGVKQGLFDEFPTQILGDASGTLWISAPRGIFAIKRAELDAFQNGETSEVHPTLFDTADGMKTSEASIPETQPAGSIAPDGKLWFTTRKGAVQIDPANLVRNTVPPPVIIEEMVVDGKTLKIDAQPQLRPGTDRLEIRYTALSLQVPHRVQFKYMLDGYDHEWINAGMRRVAYYTNLSPGSYRFRVMASNNDGLWSTAATTAAFTVKPHFYQTWWFILLSLTSAVLAVLGWHRWRLRQLSRLADTLSRQVADRTRELETANKQMQQTQATLATTARQAGMAEIANNVLHNVGNVLNSVNISAQLISNQLRHSKSPGLAKAVNLMNEHAADLGQFLALDERGKTLPGYLNKLVCVLATEKQGIAAEVEALTRSIDHIKEIVATQQSYSGTSSLIEPVQLRDLLEDALRMNLGSGTRHQITVVKEFAEVPLLLLDKHLMLQILINLISNAKHAVDAVPEQPHKIKLTMDILESTDTPRLRIRVEDNGEGIAPENLTRLFAHGFTTRKNGHGFGLHSCALAMKEMRGSIAAFSDGLGRGAVFALEFPMKPVQESV